MADQMPSPRAGAYRNLVKSLAPGRMKAFKVGLAAIDSNVAKKGMKPVGNVESQEFLLQETITRISKTRPPLTYKKQKPAGTKTYDGKTLRSHMSDILGNIDFQAAEENGAHWKKGVLHDLFQQGSCVLPDEFLREILYKKPTPRSRKPKSRKSKTNEPSTTSASSDQHPTPATSDQAVTQGQHVTQQTVPEVIVPQDLIADQGNRNEKRKLDEEHGDVEVAQLPTAKRSKGVLGSSVNESDSHGREKAVVEPVAATQDATAVPHMVDINDARSMLVMGVSESGEGLISKVEILPVQAGGGTASGTTDAVPSLQQTGEPRPEARQDFYKNISVSMQEHLEIKRQKLGLENGDLQEHVESCNVISYDAGPVPEGISMGKISTNKLAWTEIDTDPNDRLRKNGLPALRQNSCSTVDMLSQWPRPPCEISNLSQGIGDYYEELKTNMDTVRHEIENVVAHYSKKSSAPKGGKAKIVTTPEPELTRIYARFFGSVDGKSWMSEACTMLELGMFSSDLMEGLIGAAVHGMVFEEVRPHKTADEWFNMLRYVGPYWDEAMQAKGSKVALDEVVWSGLRKQMNSSTYQDHVIMPKAKELADRLRTILHPQLELVGVTGSTTQDNQLFWHIASAGLTSCFMAALTVKGLLEAMPVEAEFKWISAGMPYVGTDMDRQPGSPSLNDPGTTATVARAVTPSLRYRDPEVSSSSGWIWVTKAKGILLRTTG